MSYVVMARKWRPQTFETIVGQEHVVRTLKNAISANRISHAYLFTGPRGVGKTTTARLLAKAINCLSPAEGGEPCNHCVRCEEIVSGSSTDVIEIDAASNGLVDDARDLREKVRYAPLACRYKVMIIDEVHMMSNAAFNALLKTLEEPPAHTVFILATTESHKVPATIISRCQKFDFRRIPVKEIADRLATMAAAEGVTVSEEALHVVARGADGSLRDAQSLFDQIVSFSGKQVTAADVVAVLGLVDTQVFIDLIDAVARRDAAQSLALVEQLVAGGADLRLFMKDWVDYWRSLVIARVAPERAGGASTSRGEDVVRQSRLFPQEELIELAKMAATADDELRRTQHPRLFLELFLLRLCAAERVVSLESLWRELQSLEQRAAEWPAAAAVPASTPSASTKSPEPPQTVDEVDAVDEVETAKAELPEPGEPALVVDALEEAVPESPLAVYREQWDAVMQLVGQKNRRVQALLRDVTVTAGEPGWVELTCVSAYHQTGLEKSDARSLVESVLEAHFGRSIRMRLKTAGGAEAEAEAGQDPNAREKEFAEVARKEPLVQKTLELFDAKIVDIIGK